MKNGRISAEAGAEYGIRRNPTLNLLYQTLQTRDNIKLHSSSLLLREAYPVISAPLAVGDLEQFEVEADFIAEHFQQIDAESRAAVIFPPISRRVSCPEQTHYHRH